MLAPSPDQSMEASSYPVQSDQSTFDVVEHDTNVKGTVDGVSHNRPWPMLLVALMILGFAFCLGGLMLLGVGALSVMPSASDANSPSDTAEHSRAFVPMLAPSMSIARPQGEGVVTRGQAKMSKGLRVVIPQVQQAPASYSAQPRTNIKEDAKIQELKDQLMSGLSDASTKKQMMKRLTLKINDVNRDAEAQEQNDMVGSDFILPPPAKIVLMPKPNIIFTNPQDDVNGNVKA